jgi:NitT/TauT family transport system substrate-binding protein
MQLGRRGILALAAAAAARPARAAQTVRLGMLKTLSPAPFYIAREQGLFAKHGVEVEFVFFQAAQPIAAAAVAGDIDVGVTALTGGFFSLAGKGTLKVIGGGLHEEAGKDLTAILVSKRAYAGGLTSVEKLGGHSLAITQYGSSFHYMAGQLAARKGFDLKTVTLRPVQSIGNMLAAVRTGQVDATMAIASQAKPAAASGDVHIIGWVGDYLPYQITALFTTQAMIAHRAAALHGFCDGYKDGVAAYRAAFLADQPSGTDAAMAAITKYVFTGDAQAAAKIKAGIGWYDPGGALDVADVKSQLAWFQAQDMVKGQVDAADIIETGFLPTR